MNRVVVQRRRVQERDVPHVEIDRPDRQRDQRMREKTQPIDRPQREHRPEHRPGQAGDEAQRCEIAEQDVLEHVHEEEVLFAECGTARRHGPRHSRHEERDDVGVALADDDFVRLDDVVLGPVERVERAALGVNRGLG